MGWFADGLTDTYVTPCPPDTVRGLASLMPSKKVVPMESVSLRSYSDVYPCLWHGGPGKHPNINVETQIPLENKNYGKRKRKRSEKGLISDD